MKEPRHAIAENDLLLESAMKYRAIVFFLLGLSILSVISSCRKSDSEMKEELVGTWNRMVCMSASDEESEFFWFYGEIKFLSDGRFVESGNLTFCKEYCYTDTIGSSQVDHCTCQYSVQDGCLVITPDGDNVQGHFSGSDFPYNIEIPIVKVGPGKLVLDEVEYNGVKIECSCFGLE